jgi:nicotinamidase-related amidase
MNPFYYSDTDVEHLARERVADVVAAAAERRESATDAASDKFKVAVFGIDPQNSFVSKDGTLSVPGAVDDMKRTVEWIYSNVGRITKFIISLDTHTIHQVFHPSFWMGKDGKHPAPFTSISTRDISDGVWTPNLPGQRDFKDLKRAMMDYTSQLEVNGKYALTIWPYHTLLGSWGHNVNPALMEAIVFHTSVRRADPSFVIKGSNPYTENFSVLSPEVTTIANLDEFVNVGRFNTGLADTLRKYDRIYVFGQAKSHCVMSTLQSIHSMYGADSDFMKKIFILEDTMSAIPAPPIDPLPDALNFPKVTEEAFAVFAKAGMHLVSTKEPKE